jgi:hypothetical protein
VVVSTGNAGQCDYAAANEIAEQIALEWRAQHPGSPLVKAIAWGPWNGGMVSPDLAAQFNARGMPLIPLAEGADAFLRELAGPTDQVRSLITAGGEAPLARAGEIELSEVSQAWLADHRIGGRAVVPLAVVCDWMLRLIDAPGVRELRDIHVVQGIAAPALVTVRRRGSVLTVATGAGDPCYRARLGTAADSDAGFGTTPEGLEPVDRDPVYDGETLFHGATLRTIRKIEGVGPAGAVGEILGMPRMRDWPQEPWRTDPAALDGAIQLAVVWAWEQTGRATLPMSVREARFRPAGPEPGPLRCTVRAVSVEDHRAVCDLWLTRPDGTTAAALSGLELVARPHP